MTEFRTEHDSMGQVKVPARAYYGAQTQRAVENFPVSGWALRPELIRAMGLVKWACGIANRDLGKLTGTGKNPLNDAQVVQMLAAAREVAGGTFDGEFPIDVFQTGSGTSSNMNCNEVISNRAIELAGGDRFQEKKPIHPNDHVNMGQSTNDTFPTAIHVAVAMAIQSRLIPALESLRDVLREKAQAWDKIIKIGRTHLADATPLRLGQEFGGFGASSNFRSNVPVRRSSRFWSCRWAERRSGRGSTPIRSSRGGSAKPWRMKRNWASTRPKTTSKGTLSGMGWSSATVSCGRLP